MGVGPHFRVLFFFLLPPAEPQSEDRERADYCSTDFSISTQASPESAHGPDDFFVSPAQLLLPDRKNSLASMEALHHHLHRFPPHFFQRHHILLLLTMAFSRPKRCINFFENIIPTPLSPKV
jgi:hypothetical protein